MPCLWYFKVHSDAFFAALWWCFFCSSLADTPGSHGMVYLSKVQGLHSLWISFFNPGLSKHLVCSYPLWWHSAFGAPDLSTWVLCFVAFSQGKVCSLTSDPPLKGVYEGSEMRLSTRCQSLMTSNFKACGFIWYLYFHQHQSHLGGPSKYTIPNRRNHEFHHRYCSLQNVNW